ncbi:TetR family transcriptional regulator [Catellatospora methionotrophica]|uniref:TetR family transcriptional regulator n=1 Tax=Catellatospora methionotrophica TaxID=121620 RepID=A0A8J3PFG7_9ACTN|nr:TetR/AcrR family transcriptional regulator [Catellatospora methionotrophica]GIG14689.1 TetR family transcriptional regulator [Catellatospora methionotrophica]
MEPTTTLRERKKEATRQALHEAVLRLAVERGLDAVTVDAIADEANVSRRTFSNYFANKEDALLYGDRVRIERLLDLLRARPAGESPWQAMTAAAQTQFTQLGKVDPNWVAQTRLLRRHPSLLAQQAAAQATLEQELAAEIAARDPGHPDEPARSRVLAAVFMATLRCAFGLWVEQRGGAALPDAVRAAFDRAAEPFA